MRNSLRRSVPITATLASLLATPLLAASAVPPEAIEAMKPLSWMIGEWSGEGFASDREGRHRVLQTERIEPQLEGALLVVQGTGYAPPPEGSPDGARGDVRFRAFGVFSQGETPSTFRFVAWQGGRHVDAKAVLKDDGSIEWGFPTPDGGEVKYTITRPSPDVWHEVGAYRRPGMEWVPTFEMTLQRAGSGAQP